RVRRLDRQLRDIAAAVDRREHPDSTHPDLLVRPAGSAPLAERAGQPDAVRFHPPDRDRRLRLSEAYTRTARKSARLRVLLGAPRTRVRAGSTVSSPPLLLAGGDPNQLTTERRNLLLDAAGASQEVERGDNEHGDAQHSGEVLRERHSLTCLEDVVEEEEVHQQEPDDDSDSECLLHVPSLFRRLGPAPEQPRDTFVRRERKSTPPSSPNLHELTTGRCGCPLGTWRFRRNRQRSLSGGDRISQAWCFRRHC